MSGGTEEPDWAPLPQALGQHEEEGAHLARDKGCGWMVAGHGGEETRRGERVGEHGGGQGAGTFLSMSFPRFAGGSSRKSQGEVTLRARLGQPADPVAPSPTRALTCLEPVVTVGQGPGVGPWPMVLSTLPALGSCLEAPPLPS